MTTQAPVIHPFGPEKDCDTIDSAGSGFTIDRAAAFAGVDVTTVRYYHQQGLVDEPEGDSSGCRPYGSAELLRLVQVRVLAGAGVPLTEIKDLLGYLAEVEALLGIAR